MNHFHFPSGNPKETIEFYERYFGFSRAKVIGQTHVLRGNNSFILAIDEASTGQPLSEQAHLGFQLSEAPKVKSLFDQMEREGIRICGTLNAQLPRFIHFYCLDPTGNKIEVGWYQL